MKKLSIIDFVYYFITLYYHDNRTLITNFLSVCHFIKVILRKNLKIFIEKVGCILN